MKRSIKKLALVSVLCVMPLGMGGCCEKCVRSSLLSMWSLYTSLATAKKGCCQRSTTPQEYQMCAEQIDTVFLAASTSFANALAACSAAEYERAKEILKDLEEFIRTINPRLLPVAMSPNKVVEVRDGVFANSTPLFMPSDTIELWITASTDGVQAKRETIIVDGQEMLPEAAGGYAVKKTVGDRPEGQPSTLILPPDADLALKFRRYVVDQQSMIDTSTLLGQMTFDVTGDFELSTLQVGADGAAQAIPRDAEFAIRTDIGSIVLRLDHSNPGNRLHLGADGKGMLRGSFAVKGTGDLDIVTELAPELWIELPVAYDQVSGGIDLSFAGAIGLASVVRHRDDSTDSGNRYNVPEEIRVGCGADGIGIDTGECACVDTDGDGVPDSYAFESSYSSQYKQHLEVNWCDND